MIVLICHRYFSPNLKPHLRSLTHEHCISEKSEPAQLGSRARQIPSAHHFSNGKDPARGPGCRVQSAAYFCCWPPCLSLFCLGSPWVCCCGVWAGDAGFCVSLDDGVFVMVCILFKKNKVRFSYLVKLDTRLGDFKMSRLFRDDIFSAAALFRNP